MGFDRPSLQAESTRIVYAMMTPEGRQGVSVNPRSYLTAARKRGVRLIGTETEPIDPPL